MIRLELGDCVLRPWADGDVEALVRHANDRDVSRNLRDRFPFPYTEADARGWIAIAAEPDPLTNVAIEVDGEAVGGVGLDPRDPEDVERHTAEIGYWLGRAVWGRGLATQAVIAWTAYAFRTFPALQRLEAGVYGWNPASMRVLEKAGYTREGTARRAVVKDGAFTDRVLFGILREEVPG